MATKTAPSKAASKSSSNPGSSPGQASAFTKEVYLRWFKDMLLMRRFEEKTGQLYTMQKFGGFCHLYIGQ